MKFNKIFSALAVAAVAAVFASCDDVKENDRYIDAGAVQAERNVLLLDFTGQNCVNCPDAHEVIEELEKQYNDDGKYHLVAVAVHSGSLALSSNATNFGQNRVGLMVKEGTDLMEAWGINTFPRGVIDLTGSSLEYPEWAGAVRSAFEKPSHVNISATATFVPGANESYGSANGISGTINVTASVLSDEGASDAKIQMWVVEDNITARQKMPSGNMNEEYVHNNVFRGQFYDGDGQTISIYPGTATSVENSIPAKFTNKERWMLENIGIVVYVIDKNGVMQVERIPVKLPEGYQQPEA